MHRHEHHHNISYPALQYQPGLLTLFGSAIGLTSATLWGGAHVVKRIVEGSLWESCGSHHGCGCSRRCGCGGCGCAHCCIIECRPAVYRCSCCCC
jgi:hypothetical protein